MFEMVEAHSKCMQIFAIAYLYERIRFSSMAALMQLKYSVSMAHTFVSHIQYARIYFLHTHTHAHIRSRSLCFCLSPPSDPVFPARQFLPLPRSLSASICTVHSFVRFFASAKIFNLNMYNASKKLPSTSINIDRLTVSGIHLKDLSRKIPKHSRVHLAAWIPYYSLSISSVSVSSIRVYVSMCEVVCVCFKCVLRKAERILSHICLGRRSSSSYFARCS